MTAPSRGPRSWSRASSRSPRRAGARSSTATASPCSTSSATWWRSSTARPACSTTTRASCRALCFTLEGHRPLMLSSTVQTDNVTLDVDLTNPDIFIDGELVLAKDTFHVARAKFLWQGKLPRALHRDELRRARAARCGSRSRSTPTSPTCSRSAATSARAAARCAPKCRGPAEVVFAYDSVDGVPRATRICFDRRAGGADRRARGLRARARARASAARSRSRVHCQQGASRASAEQRFFTALRRARRALAGERAGRAARRVLEQRVQQRAVALRRRPRDADHRDAARPLPVRRRALVLHRVRPRRH